MSFLWDCNVKKTLLITIPWDIDSGIFVLLIEMYFWIEKNKSNVLFFNTEKDWNNLESAYIENNKLLYCKWLFQILQNNPY